MEIIIFFILLSLSCGVAVAGGGATGGATEWTQIMNNIQLGDSYAQQVMSYQNQLLQYQAMLQNLAAHPMGNITPDLLMIARNSGKVISASSDIGSSMARVDQNLAGQFQNPTAVSYSDRFRSLTSNSQNSLKAAMLNAGLQREHFASDSDALAALVMKNQASNGNLNAIQTVGDINAQQLQEQMKLRDLISEQQIAQGNYIAAQSSKEQMKQDRENAILIPADAVEPMKKETEKIVNWNSVLHKN